MGYTPHGEKTVETKKCAISGEEFFVTDKDLQFYDKVSPIFGDKKHSIPAPNLCPEERLRRRLSMVNVRNLYNNASGIISPYSSDKAFYVLDLPDWHDDKTVRYGQDPDFSKTLSEQFRALQKNSPRWSRITADSENCDWCINCASCKDCYLTRSSYMAQNCFYTDRAIHCEFVSDSYWINDSSYATECIESDEIYNSHFIQDCQNLSDCFFAYSCSSLKSCIACVNLRNKEFCILNKQVSKELFEDTRNRLFSDKAFRSQVLADFKKLKQSQPHRASTQVGCENVIGDKIYNSKNIAFGLFVTDCEDCKYIDTGSNSRSCHDVTQPDMQELCYETISNFELYQCSFVFNSLHLNRCYYMETCDRCDDCFLCVGLFRGNHCLLNKAYAKHEYEELSSKLVEHMHSTGEWGEFFSSSNSPFGYNESGAYEYFPLSQEEVLQNGWNWKEEDETSSYHGDYYTPLPIKDYNERVVGIQTASQNIHECVQGIHQCQATKRPFKVIKQELAFYIENNIPVPTICPDERHLQRMGLRNPRKLWERTCNKCDNTMFTSHSPDSGKTIYCEDCYRKEVY